ncbi:MAG: hypothetical protein ACR2I0_11475 [Rhodoferax sp.]
MRINSINRLAGVAAALGLGLAFAAELPQVDFSVELRQVDDQSEGGYSVTTRPRAGALVAQRVTVRNGEKALLRWSQSVPMQWVQKMETQSTTGASATPTNGQTTGAGITNALVWMEAGQSLVVTPHWPGGKQPVGLEIDIQKAALEGHGGSELPRQQRSQTLTTLRAPLGEWVTVASEGEAPTSGSYSSAAAAQAPRKIQIRVTPN